MKLSNGKEIATKLLNGKELADKVKEEVKTEVENMVANGQNVRLAVIQVGDDAASSTYVRNKQNALAMAIVREYH